MVERSQINAVVESKRGMKYVIQVHCRLRRLVEIRDNFELS